MLKSLPKMFVQVRVQSSNGLLLINVINVSGTRTEAILRVGVNCAVLVDCFKSMVDGLIGRLSHSVIG